MRGSKAQRVRILFPHVVFTFTSIILVVLAVLITAEMTTAKTYPSYCSTKEDQLSRKIPPLRTTTQFTQNTKSLTLQHVTTIIRHGSRTPWAPHKCWEGYTSPDADTSTWTCSLTSMMRPQSSEAVDIEYLVDGISEQIIQMSGKGQFFSFDKLYNANWSPKHPNHFPQNVANDLRGNCQKGQLILKGHAQQVNNAHALRSAYIKYDDYIDPTVGVLLDFVGKEQGVTIVGERAYDEPRLYFRSDDDERTLMSGMILLEGMYGSLMKDHEAHYKAEEVGDGDRIGVPVIAVHTADRDKDILAPNSLACPRLVELEMEAIGSPGYQEKFVRSEEAVVMKNLSREQFGGLGRMQDADEAVDCVMTTVCEDKTLPYALDEEQSGDDQDILDKYGQNLFQRFVDFNVGRVAYVYNYKGGAFSKLSTNPLWNDILAGLLVHTNADEYEMRRAWPDLRPKSKFALYSAHDTTIMSLLASLGPNVYGGDWPPYASMVNIELYDIEWTANADVDIRDLYPTNIGFRLLYNGQPITDHISGCSKGEEICDIDLLVLHVYPFANVTEWADQCKLQNPIGIGGGTNDDILDHTKGHHAGSGGSQVVLILMGGLLCAVCGAFVTFLYMSKFVVSGQKQHPHHPIPFSNDEHSLELTKTQMNDSVGPDGKIYGLPAQQEGRDII